MYFEEQEPRPKESVTQTPGAAPAQPFPQLQSLMAARPIGDPDSGGGGGDNPYEPPTTPTTPPGNPGGGGSNPTGEPKSGPAAGPIEGPKQTANSGPLGTPQGAQLGSFRNIQQFLETNAPKEQKYAQQYSNQLQKSATESVNKPGNIPTPGEYDAAKYPIAVAGVGAKPSPWTAVPVPVTPEEPHPWFGGPQAWADWRAAEAKTREAEAQNAAAKKAYDDALAKWEKDSSAASAADKANIEAGKKGPNPIEVAKADTTGWQLGRGATPGGYQEWLSNRGVGQGNARLDSYLYGAAPGGVQGDVRNLQQQYGGLLGLVKNWTPYGSTIDKTGMAAPISKDMTGAPGTGAAPVAGASPGPTTASGPTKEPLDPESKFARRRGPGTFTYVP